MMISKPRDAGFADVEKQQLYYEYKQRRADRRAYALDARRQMNSGKVHRYWTAVAVPYNPLGGPSAIQQGMVRLPPIPRRYTWGDWAVDMLREARRTADIVESHSR